jgi:hypothetical protein
MQNDRRRRDVLRGLAGAAVVVPGLARGEAAAQAPADSPIVPLISFFNHWDHHWYVWLRGDPTYEAVEIMSRDRGVGVPPLVWVFFTERASPKRQTNYINDQRTAAAFAWQFRDIAFSTSGSPGGSQSLSAALADSRGQPISIEVERDSDAVLSPERGGLTNQIGHSGDRFILLFYRELGALARTARVTISGEEISQPRPGASFSAPFAAAYSRNILVGGFPFADRRLTFDCGSNRCVAALPDRTTVELDIADNGELLAYRHRDGDHQLAIRFAPSLPPAKRLPAGFRAKFALSLDEFGDLVSGSLKAGSIPGGAAFDWTFETPDWMQGRAMQTTYLAAPDQGTSVEIRTRATKAGPQR